jgi:DNA-directed RNA polymerase beta subunit
MEEWVLNAHGVPKFISEKFYDHSDGYTEYMCRCGRPAIVNVEQNVYKCHICRDNAEIFKVPTSWSSKLLFHELGGMEIGVLRKPEPFIFEKMEE